MPEEAAGQDRVDVSVVLPVFNEAGHVGAEVDRIRAALESSPHTYELILVDDGSTDDSAQRLRQLGSLDGVRVITFGRNRGSGAARRAGTRAARGDIVVWTDVDMTYPNDDIPLLVKELEGFDQVVGARRTEEGSHKLLRAPAKWAIRMLASRLSRTDIPDLNSGFRAFRAPVARQFVHLLPNGFSCVTTMTMTFLMNGYSVKYIPISYAARAGRSKFHWWRDTKKYLTQVARLIMSYDPLRIFVPIGIVLFTLGTGKLIYDFVVNPWKVAADTLLVLFAAAQVWGVGLLADLFVHLNKPKDEIDPADRAVL